MHRGGEAPGEQGLMPRPILVGAETVTMGSEAIEYQLFRSDRRTLGIAVEPGGQLRVTAPRRAELGRIEGVLRRRREWIQRQLRDARDRPPPSPRKQWVGGETHRYLGRQYRLRIRAGKPSVSLEGGHFEVRVTRKDPELVKSGMERWYRDHARALFGRRTQALIDVTPRLRMKEAPEILVRQLSRRWGSCTPNGKLVLNTDVVKLPIGCVDYVLMHELCHQQVPHHGRQFWRLLEVCMPDWERWRERMGRSEV